ncbi:MAG: hypothetical protein K2J79_09500, partial [Ruminiclostridium sp.]|nr:hypothetical protein [Ruminiclostridium sp.]
MSKKLFDLFENADFSKEVGNGDVCSIIYNKKGNSMLIQLSMEDVPESKEIFEAADIIKKRLALMSAEIYPKYPSVLFSAERIYHIIDLLRAKPNLKGKINGYLNNAEISEGDGIYEISLKNGGGDILSEGNIDKEIEKYAKGFFDVSIKVILTELRPLTLTTERKKLSRTIPNCRPHLLK